MINGISEVCDQSRGLLGIISSVGAIRLELRLLPGKESLPQFSIILGVPTTGTDPVILNIATKRC